MPSQFPNSPYTKELNEPQKRTIVHLHLRHLYNWKNTLIEVAILHIGWFNCLVTSLTT